MHEGGSFSAKTFWKKPISFASQGQTEDFVIEEA